MINFKFLGYNNFSFELLKHLKYKLQSAQHFLLENCADCKILSSFLGILMFLCAHIKRTKSTKKTFINIRV